MSERTRLRRRLREYARRLRPFVLIRDDFRCRLCGQPIDPRLPGDHPMAATVDHIVPLGRGGPSNEFNLQAAHRACNEAKSSVPRRRA